MFPVSYCNNNKGDTVLFLFQNGVDSGDYLHFFAVTMEWKLLQWGLPRGFGDRWHCSKMWRQSFSDSLTADKSWKKKGDNLRQRQSIVTFDKATCFVLLFSTATLLQGSVIPLWPYKVYKPFNCCCAACLLFLVLALRFCFTVAPRYNEVSCYPKKCSS